MKEYDSIGKYYNGIARVQLNGKFGFIDESKEEICKLKYDSIWNFNVGFAIIRIKDKYGYINDKFIEVVPCEYYYEVDNQLEKYKLKLLRKSKLDRIL